MNKTNYTSKAQWIKFNGGNLKNIQLYMTKDYAKFFENENTDFEMMSSIDNLQPLGKTIFDVGGFIGASSLVFAKMVGKEGRVITFEPNPFNLKRLKKNLAKNPKFADRVEIYTEALSDSNGIMTMYLSDNVDNGHSSTSRIDISHSKIANNKLPDSFTNLEIETKKLDDFVIETGIIPDIIKIDIEGAEHLLLEGGTTTLAKYKPILYIEIHSEYCAIRCYEILNHFDYTLSVIHEEPDNRIMVKAIPIITKKYSEPEQARLILSKIENISDNLLSQSKTINQQMLSIHNIEKNLSEQIDINVSLEKQNNENHVLISKIKFELDEIYKSRSWRLIKALRKHAPKFRGIK